MGSVSYKYVLDIDTSKAVNQVQELLKTIQKSKDNKVDISADTSGFMNDIEKQIKEIQAQLDGLKIQKLDIQGVDLKPIEDLIAKIGELNTAIDAVNGSKLSLGIDKSAADSLVNAAAGLQVISENLEHVIQLKNELNGATSSGVNSNSSVGLNKNLQAQVQAFKDLKKARDEAAKVQDINENEDLRNSNINTDEAKSRLTSLQAEYTRLAKEVNLANSELNSVFNNKNSSLEDQTNAIIKQKDAIVDFIAVSKERATLLNDIQGTSAAKSSYMNMADKIDEAMSVVQQKIDGSLSMVNASFKNSTGDAITNYLDQVMTVTTNKKTGNQKITIPVTLQTNSGEILKEVQGVVDSVKSKFESSPIEIKIKPIDSKKIIRGNDLGELEKTVKAQMKTVQETLSGTPLIFPDIQGLDAFKKSITEAKESITGFESILATMKEAIGAINSANKKLVDLKKNYASTKTTKKTSESNTTTSNTSPLKSSDELTNLTAELNKAKAVNTALKEQITNIQTELQSASKDNIKEIDFSKMFAGLDSSLAKVISAMQEVSKSISTNMTNASNVAAESVNTIIESLTRLEAVMKSIAGMSIDAGLDSQWSSITEGFNKIASSTGKIDLRSQKAQLQDLLSIYNEYVSAGGKNTLSDLTNNSSTVSKMEKIRSEMIATATAKKELSSAEADTTGKTDSSTLNRELVVMEQLLPMFQDVATAMKGMVSDNNTFAASCKESAAALTILVGKINDLEAAYGKVKQPAINSTEDTENAEGTLKKSRDAIQASNLPADQLVDTSNLNQVLNTTKATTDKIRENIKSAFKNTSNDISGAMDLSISQKRLNTTVKSIDEAGNTVEKAVDKTLYEVEGKFKNAQGKMVSFSGEMGDNLKFDVSKAKIQLLDNYTQSAKEQNAAEKELINTKQQLANVQGSLDNQNPKDMVAGYQEAADKLQAQINTTKAALEGMTASSENQEQIGQYRQQITGLADDVKKVGDSYAKINNKGYTLVEDTVGKTDINNFKQVADQYASSLGKINTAKTKVDTNLGKVGYVIETAEGKIIRLNAVLDSGSGSLRTYQTTVGESISGLQRMGNAFKTLGDIFVNFFSGYMIMTEVFQQMRQGFKFVTELDSALTTISMTMPTTTNSLQELSTQSIQTAKDLRSTIDEVTNVAQIYANETETVQGILNKTKPTIMLANASGLSASESADVLQGIVNQYTNLAEKEQYVDDVLESISAKMKMNFGQGIQNMSEGIQKAGSIAEQAGMSFETFASSIGVISEVTRNDGGSIGNGLKMIFGRISRVSDPDEEALSSEEVSKIAAAYKSVGINVYSADGKFQNIETTLSELADKWDNLTDAQKNYIKYFMLPKLFCIAWYLKFVSYVGNNILQLGEPLSSGCICYV